MIKLGDCRFRNKTKLKNFVLAIVRYKPFDEPLDGNDRIVFEELLKFHPNDAKANADPVEIWIGPNAKGYSRGNSPYMKTADGKTTSFSILGCIDSMPYEKPKKSGYRPSGPARYIVFIKSGKTWSKCSYCGEKLGGKPLRWNPNPNARKPAVCIPCYDGMKDIPEEGDA